MSEFSDFIRYATPEEKERVYMDVIEKSVIAQIKLIEEAHREAKNSKLIFKQP